MPAPTIHLLHGFVGAGKTTFAKRLQQERKAMRYTIDEWMGVLYGTNPDPSHYADYHERTVALIWKNAEQAAAAGVDVILDFGFWNRAARDDARARVAAMGAKPLFYNIRCADSETVSRVLQRSAALPAGEVFIDEAAIDSFRARFEPMDAATEEFTLVET